MMISPDDSEFRIKFWNLFLEADDWFCGEGSPGQGASSDCEWPQKHTSRGRAAEGAEEGVIWSLAVSEGG